MKKSNAQSQHRAKDAKDIPKKSPHDYVEFVKTFSFALTSGSNTLQWSVLQKVTFVSWSDTVETSGIDPAAKLGTMNLTIEGSDPHISEGMPDTAKGWGVKIYSANIGIMKVKISTFFNDPSNAGTLPELLRNDGFKVIQLQCGESNYSGYSVDVYGYSNEQVKGWFVYIISCGSSGCSEETILFYSEPEEQQFEGVSSEYCNQ